MRAGALDDELACDPVDRVAPESAERSDGTNLDPKKIARFSSASPESFDGSLATGSSNA
jgi:hypothetical protein